MRKMTLQHLAEELRQISMLYDPYGYADCYSSTEEAYEYFEELLTMSGVKDLQKVFDMLEDIRTFEGEEFTAEHKLWAERLLWQLQDYKTYTKKDDKYAVLPMKNSKTYSISGDTEGHINEITGDFVNKLHAYESTHLSPEGVKALIEERNKLVIQVEKQKEFLSKFETLIKENNDLFSCIKE